MYLQFIELVIFTCVTVMGIKLGSNYFFNNMMFLRTSKNIQDKCEEWIKDNDQDEWILANTNEKNYIVNKK